MRRKYTRQQIIRGNAIGPDDITTAYDWGAMLVDDDQAIALKELHNYTG